MSRGRGAFPRRGVENLRRANDDSSEGLQRATRPLKQEDLRPPHTQRLHLIRTCRALMAQGKGGQGGRQGLGGVTQHETARGKWKTLELTFSIFRSLG